MRKLIKYCLFFILMQSGLILFAQELRMNYSSENKPLSVVLGEISDKYSLKLAYDTDVFQRIQSNFELKNATLGEFLKLLETKYNIHSKLIENTWVLVYAQPETIEVAAPAPSEKKKVFVSGYVKDGQTGEYLLYCNVVYGNNKGAITNDLGFFSFETPKPDDNMVKILISHLGYQKLDTIIGCEKPAIFNLKPAGVLMQDIVINQVEKNVLEATQHSGKIGFNPLKSANFPRLAEDDMANALLIIPGINFLQNSAAGLSIRGSSPTDNLVLFDGITVLETSHLLGNMSVLNSKYVHQAFVSRGGFDAEFGGRVAGLIELTGQSGKNSGPYLDLSANMMNTNLLANLPITKKVSVTAAWRRSFIDQWQNYMYERFIDDIQPDNNVISPVNPTIKYQDVNANISFHPSNNLEFNANILYGSDYQERDYSIVNTSNYFRNEMATGENLGLSFNWNWQINQRWFQGFTASYSNFDKSATEETGNMEEVTALAGNQENGKGKGKGLLKIKEKTYSQFVNDIDNGDNAVEEYRLNWKTEFKTGILSNQAGVGWTANSYKFSYFANRSNAQISVDSITGSAMLYMLNGFIQQYIQVAPSLMVRWGLHTNFDLQSLKTFWQPRAGVEFTPVQGLKLHYAYGIYYQFLSTAKKIDSEGHFNSIWYLPDNNGLGLVKGTHHIAGITFEKNGWMVDAEAYMKNSDGKINLFAEPVYTGNQWQIKYFPRETLERSRGVDVFIQNRQKYFNHFVGYSLSKTEEQSSETLEGAWYPAYIDRLHQLKLNEVFTWKSWSLTGSWHYGSGLPIINLTANSSLEQINRSEYFSQLDFALVKKFNMNHFSANVGVSLLNVLDRNNIVEVDYLRFSSETGSLSVRSDVSALGFTPLFFINIRVQ